MTARTDWSVLRTHAIHKRMTEGAFPELPWLYVVGVLAVAVTYLYS